MRPRVRRVVRWLRTPKALAIVTLSVLAASAASSEGVDRVGLQLVFAAGAAVAVDLVLGRLRGVPQGIPDGALITGLIVAMVLIGNAPPSATVAAAGIGVGSKHLLRTGQVHLFNPAAVGLLLCVALFPTGQSWWGAQADLPWPAVLLLIGCAVMVANRVHRLPTLLAFLGMYFALLLVIALALAGALPRVAEIFRIPFLNAAIFASGFMLTDPGTSPGRLRDQIWFAGIAAVGSVVSLLAASGLWYLLAGLLAANAWWAWRRTLGVTRTVEGQSQWAGAGHGN